MDNPNRQWTLIHYDAPWLINRDRTMHYMARHKLIKEWQWAFKMLAMEAKLPKNLDHISVEITHFFTSKRSPDWGSCEPAAKAALDGLVQYGLVKDDAPRWVETHHMGPVRAKKPALQLVIKEIANE